jgi:hypothetical protein
LLRLLGSKFFQIIGDVAVVDGAPAVLDLQHLVDEAVDEEIRDASRILLVIAVRRVSAFLGIRSGQG